MSIINRLNRAFNRHADDESEETPEETPAKKSRKPEPPAPRQPTQLESARTALTAVQEAVANIQRQLAELDNYQDSLEPVLSTAPVAARLERDNQLAQITNTRAVLNKQLGEANAFLTRRQSELSSTFDRATEAAKRVTYYEARLAPLKSQEATIREQIAKIQGMLTDDFKHAIGVHTYSIIAGSASTLQLLLSNELPRAQSEYDTARAELERIGVPK